MSHKDAPPETPSQIACRLWWQARQPHVTRAWGRAKDGNYLAEETRNLHAAWEAALAQQPAIPEGVTIRAFVAADSGDKCISINHPAGQTWVPVTQGRDVALWQMLHAAQHNREGA